MEIFWLGLAAFVGSTLTGIMGVGGGVLILVIMAQFVPPSVLIPLHALVMLYSNLNRVVIQRRHIRWSYVWPFLAAGVIAIALVSRWVNSVPVDLGQLLLGLFVLIATWRPNWFQVGQWPASLSGGITGALSMFLGAMGPIVMAVLPRAAWSRHEIIATHGMVMGLQYGVKALAFAWIGFEWIAYLPALVAMCLAATLGNLAGARLLGRVSEQHFKFVLNTLLTVLALRLVVQYFA